MRRTASARTFTVEVEVHNLNDDTMNQLDDFINNIRLNVRSIETLLGGRMQGDAAVVITDEKHSTETADLELF